MLVSTLIFSPESAALHNVEAALPHRRRRASLSSLARLASPVAPSLLLNAILVPSGVAHEASLDAGVQSFWQTGPLAMLSAAAARDRFAEAGSCLLIAGPVASILPVSINRASFLPNKPSQPLCEKLCTTARAAPTD